MKRSPLNPRTKKQQAELRKRAKLKAELIKLSNGLCMKCGQKPDFKDGRGELHLIHLIALSEGGQTTKNNCAVWCRKCHATLSREEGGHNLRET